MRRRLDVSTESITNLLLNVHRLPRVRPARAAQGPLRIFSGKPSADGHAPALGSSSLAFILSNVVLLRAMAATVGRLPHGATQVSPTGAGVYLSLTSLILTKPRCGPWLESVSAANVITSFPFPLSPCRIRLHPSHNRSQAAPSPSRGRTRFPSDAHRRPRTAMGGSLTGN